MMNKVAQFYRELVATLTERLRNGERDIDALVEQARARVMQTGELTRTEVEEVTRAVRRDLEDARETIKDQPRHLACKLKGALYAARDAFLSILDRYTLADLVVNRKPLLQNLRLEAA